MNLIYIYIVPRGLHITHLILFVGQSVSLDEQVDMKASTASLQEEEKPPAPPMTASVSSIVDESTKALFEEEKLKLYQQLDDKVLHRSIKIAG